MRAQQPLVLCFLNLQELYVEMGVLCSHLAIVSREFSIPALMATEIITDQPIDKKKAIIKPTDNIDGQLLLIDS